MLEETRPFGEAIRKLLAERRVADVHLALEKTALKVVQETLRGVRRLAALTCGSERLNSVGELLTGSTCGLLQTLERQLSRKVDHARTQVAEDELGKLHIELGDVDQAARTSETVTGTLNLRSSSA